VFYYNLLNLGQSWVSKGFVGLGTFMVMLHGTVLVLALLWLAKRHNNLTLRDWLLAWRNKGQRAQEARA
jgi:lipopolysaccharide export system permease protein